MLVKVEALSRCLNYTIHHRGAIGLAQLQGFNATKEYILRILGVIFALLARSNVK